MPRRALRIAASPSLWIIEAHAVAAMRPPHAIADAFFATAPSPTKTLESCTSTHRTTSASKPIEQFPVRPWQSIYSERCGSDASAALHDTAAASTESLAPAPRTRTCARSRAKSPVGLATLSTSSATLRASSHSRGQQRNPRHSTFRNTSRRSAAPCDGRSSIFRSTLCR